LSIERKVKKRPLKCSAQAKRDKGGGVPATITKHSKDLYSLYERYFKLSFFIGSVKRFGDKKIPLSLVEGEFWKVI
jgi:hypothetical protein